MSQNWREQEQNVARVGWNRGDLGVFCSWFCCGLVPDHVEALLDVQFTSLSLSESGSIIRALTGTGANGGDCEMLKDILWHREYCTHLPWVPLRSLCWRLRVVSQ